MNTDKECHRDTNASATIFRIGDLWLAIKTSIIKEIIEDRDVRKVPKNVRSALLGMVNVRGKLQICISLKSILNLEDSIENQNI